MSKPFLVPLSSISPKGPYYLAPWNPPQRIEESYVQDLVDAFKQQGQLESIKFGQDKILGDGHRRVVAAQIIGWENLLAEERPIMAVDLYREINRRKSFPGHQLISIYLANPLGVDEKHRTSFAAYERIYGRKLLETLSTRRKSTRVIRLANEVGRIFGYKSPGQIARIALFSIEAPGNYSTIQNILLDSKSVTRRTLLRTWQPTFDKILKL